MSVSHGLTWTTYGGFLKWEKHYGLSMETTRGVVPRANFNGFSMDLMVIGDYTTQYMTNDQ